MRKIMCRIGLLTAAFVLLGAGKKLKSPSPVTGDGIHISVKKAIGERHLLILHFMARSERGEVVEINRNEFTVHTDAETSYRREGGRKIHKLKPSGKHAVNIKYEARGTKFGELSGFVVTFDGLRENGEILNIPPMIFGQPDFDLSKFELKGSTPFSPKVASGGLAKAEMTKLAAMPLRGSGKGVNKELTSLLDELLLGELQGAGFEAIGPNDIQAMLGFDGMKQTMGCDDNSCIAEIGNALGVGYLAAGTVGKLDGATVLTLKLIDTKNARVISRVNRINDGGNSKLPTMIQKAVAELIRDASL